MKNLNNFDEFINTNESWRQVKGWLKMPQYYFELLLHKLINYIPNINMIYDQLSAKIDLGRELIPTKIENELTKITIDDIKNNKLKNTLKSIGLFDNWNIYYYKTIDKNQKYNLSDRGRDVIYITKDELKKGDTIYGERISDELINKNKNKTEPQIYAIVAKQSDEHEKIEKERKLRFEKNEMRALEKEVNIAIKTKNILGRNFSNSLSFKNFPVAFKVVEADRVDLMKKLIEGCPNKSEIYDMINSVVNEDGWDVEYGSNNSNYLPEKVKSIDMAKLIVKYIDAPDDKWIDNVKNIKVKEFYKTINFNMIRKTNKIIKSFSDFNS